MSQKEDNRFQRFCPVCLERLDIGELMHVAEHEQLKENYPYLPYDSQKRFHARRFDDEGRAIDEMGMPCTDLACPRCLRRFASPLVDSPPFIVSLVGDASSGKTYYLCTLIKALKRRLPEFGVQFMDAVPKDNAEFNEQISRLFGSSTPQEAHLAKTVVGGQMYEKLERQGREVMMPKPATYLVSPTTEAARAITLIFYDNAGENFQPGVSADAKPGAQHVAQAAGILFLFDPFIEPEFRRRIQAGGVNDPQLTLARRSQQDVILREMGLRIQNLRQLPSRARVHTPLAVVVGKYDGWQHLIRPDQFPSPLKGGTFSQPTLEDNSRRLRALLAECCNEVVATAEAVSDCVRYFPVSSFGHSPVLIEMQTAAPQPSFLRPTAVEPSAAPSKLKMISPDPRKIEQFQAEVPMFWLLSKICPDFLVAPSPPPKAPRPAAPA